MVTITENAAKFTRLAQIYPDHKLPELLPLMEISPVDINTAIWRAREAGWVTINDKTGEVTVLEEFSESYPKGGYPWGEDIEKTKDRVIYAIRKLNELETDMEEFILSQWFKGYGAHDLIIVLQNLIEEKRLASYSIDDGKGKGKSRYVFYTLYENKDKLWGKSAFKDQGKIKVVEE